MSGSILLFFLLFFIIIVKETPLFSQDAGMKVSRQSSIEAYSKGDYEKAYGSFSELLTIYPKDPLYKYYSGVCLIKLNRDPDRALTLLNEARQSGSVARMVPADAIYWQGRALQITGKYTEAIECFNAFTQTSGKKAARELGVPDYIDQCNRKVGKLPGSETVVAETAVKPKPEPEIIPGIPLKNDIVEMDTLKNIPVDKFLPADFDNMLSEAMFLHIKADSLYRIADSLKKDIDRLSYKERTELKTKIVETENFAASFQKKADTKYDEAQASMNATPFVPVIPDVKKIPAVRESLPVEIKNAAPVRSAPEETVIVRKDSVKVVKGTLQDVFSQFGISVKPDNSGEKVTIDQAVPAGLIYRIQLAVFRNPVQLSYFKGITPIYGFRVAGTDKTNYYAGIFRRLSDATRALTVVRKKGFKDAFIVSLLNGKVVSADRAALLEKEWGRKPFPSSVLQEIKAPADTIPPTLSFRVELMRSAKPVKDDVLEDMKKVAGSRGLDSEIISDGSIVYLAGKFITYESAEEYAGLLAKNGYRDAKVTAWLGSKEIPVDTAKQLFDRLE
jgi:hypothetical protein